MSSEMFAVKMEICLKSKSAKKISVTPKLGAMGLRHCFKVSIVSVSLSICYVAVLGFCLLRHYSLFIICLLRHCSVLGFDCIIFCACVFGHYTVSSRFPLFHCLFVSLLLCSGLQLPPLLFVTTLITILFLQGVHCFNIRL